MVTLAIVAIVFGITIRSIGRSVDRNMKKASVRLSSTIRYLYNKSAMEGLYIRLVFDLEEHSYWVEASSDPVTVSRDGDETALGKDKAAARKKEEEEKKKQEEQGGEGEAAAAAEEGGAEGGEPNKIQPPKPSFSQVDEFLLKATSLPDGILFKDICVEHRQAPVSGGQESIYFFPNGYVEKAVINLRDADDEINFSLATHPVSGQVDIEGRYRGLGEE